MTTKEKVQKARSIVHSSFEIDSQTKAVEDAIRLAAEENEGVIPEGLADRLVIIEKQSGFLALGLAGARSNIDDVIGSYESRIREARARLDALKKIRECVDVALSEAVQRRGKDGSLDLGDGRTATIRSNPQRAEVIDESLIPGEFWEIVQEKRLRKKEALEALKVGVEVPGIIMTRGYRVEVK